MDIKNGEIINLKQAYSNQFELTVQKEFACNEKYFTDYLPERLKTASQKKKRAQSRL